MTLDPFMPVLITLAVVFVPFIVFIGYEFWCAPLVDDDGNIIREREAREEHQARKPASLTPAE